METSYPDGAWQDRIEDQKGTTGTEGTKAEALEAGREQACRLKHEHIVENENGQI